jgi:hypothetical protein
VKCVWRVGIRERRDAVSLICALTRMAIVMSQFCFCVTEE